MADESASGDVELLAESSRPSDWRAELEERRRISEEERQLLEEEVAHAVQNRRLMVGMRMEDVRQVWGEPRDVGTAGDPTAGNQRWVYFDGLSSPWGLGTRRAVYFERGRLAGWERGR